MQDLMSDAAVRVRWLVRLRWIELAGMAAMMLLANRVLDNALPVAWLALTFILIAVYNVLMWSLTGGRTGIEPSEARLRALMRLQLVLDLLALTVVLHFAGGLENPLSAYYVVLVAISSIQVPKREALLYALLATLFWAAMVIFEGWGLLPHHNLVGFRLPVRYKEPLHILAEVIVVGTASFAVAHVCSSVAERLRNSERQLYEANTACELRAGQLAEANASCELRAGELASLNARLRELDQDRAFFIRLVTHELRAPVAAIQSYLRLILDGYVPEERTLEIVTKAEQRARDQLDLIGDLLDLAHIQQAKRECVEEPCDILQSLGDVLDLERAHADSKRLTVHLDVPAAISRVPLNAEHVKQVWTNLISNAIKYTPEDGEITVALSETADVVRGAVRDTGIGIAPEEIDRVFESFYRTERAKAMSRQGTGLGLSIVAGIVGHYGGRIWVESTVGEGSTFSFELPKCPPTD